MKTVTLLSATLLLAGLASSSVVNPPQNDGNFELLILHNNDMHARFEQTSQLSGACTTADREAGKCYGGFPRVAHVVKEARKAAATNQGPPVLYLNAGDTYTGTAWFTIYKWKVAAEFINAIQPDAVSLGNHEFDNGVKGLTPFIEHLQCPVLAANLVLNKVPELESETNLMNSKVFNVSNRLIGVIGYLTPETKMLAVPNDVEYTEEIVAIRKEVDKLQNEGVNILIALGHSGYTKDLEIAKEVNGIDLVIGGHTNTFLWNGASPDAENIQGPYPTLVKQASGRSVPVVQAYAYTKYLGKLHLKFNSIGEIVKVDGEPILLDNSVEQDPEVLAIVNRYRSEISNISEENVGNSTVLLDGLSCQEKECNLGNLITDAVVYRYMSDNNINDIPISMIQGGGIRSSITHVQLPITVTRGDLLTVMPFEGNLVVVKIKGKTLLEMLEHSVSNYNLIDPPGEFLQYSGVKVVYDLDKPAGSRVVRADVRLSYEHIIGNNEKYEKLDSDKTYTILIPGFVYNGGDGYKMLEGMPMEKLPYSELDCTDFYLKRNCPVTPKVEGRIKLTGKLENYSSITTSSWKVMFSLLIMNTVL